jgi:hypothetical protein
MHAIETVYFGKYFASENVLRTRGRLAVAVLCYSTMLLVHCDCPDMGVSEAKFPYKE